MLSYVLDFVTDTDADTSCFHYNWVLLSHVCLPYVVSIDFWQYKIECNKRNVVAISAELLVLLSPVTRSRCQTIQCQVGFTIIITKVCQRSCPKFDTHNVIYNNKKYINAYVYLKKLTRQKNYFTKINDDVSAMLFCYRSTKLDIFSKLHKHLSPNNHINTHATYSY